MCFIISVCLYAMACISHVKATAHYYPTPYGGWNYKNIKFTVDLAGSSSGPSTHEVRWQASTTEHGAGYFQLDFEFQNGQCWDPHLSIYYLQTGFYDHMHPFEIYYLYSVLASSNSMGYTSKRSFVRKCFGGDRAECSTWNTCCSDYYRFWNGREYLSSANWQDPVSFWFWQNANGKCNGYQIDIKFVFKCAKNPTSAPTQSPSATFMTTTAFPSIDPTIYPTMIPSLIPTISPSNIPTISPSKEATDSPTNAPSDSPTNDPSDSPSNNPSNFPTNDPTRVMTYNPSEIPSVVPSVFPSKSPSSMDPSLSSFAPSKTGNDIISTESTSTTSVIWSEVNNDAHTTHEYDIDADAQSHTSKDQDTKHGIDTVQMILIGAVIVLFVFGAIAAFYWFKYKNMYNKVQEVTGYSRHPETKLMSDDALQGAFTVHGMSKLTT